MKPYGKSSLRITDKMTIKGKGFVSIFISAFRQDIIIPLSLITFCQIIDGSGLNSNELTDIWSGNDLRTNNLT